MGTGGTCPKCGAALAEGERYCAKCGYQQQASGAEAREVGQRIGVRFAKKAYQDKIRTGRTTILAVAILLLIGAGVVYYLVNMQVDKAMIEVRQAKGNPLYDQDAVAAREKEIQSLGGQAVLLAGLNVALALTYFGLWIWAKAKPLPATLTALILFITLQVINIVMDPTTILQGIIIKAIVLIALIHAVTAAQKYQKMQQQGV